MISTANTPPCDELFDSVGQSIFGLGLQLEKCLADTEDPSMRAKLDATIQGLHDIIANIRSRGDLHCQHEHHECQESP